MNGNNERQITVLMGVDAGLAETGVAIITVPFPRTTTLKDAKIVFAKSLKTKRDDRKTRRADESMRRRLRLLIDFYNKIIEDYRPRAISLESMSYPRNSSSAAMLGMAWSALHTIATLSKIPTFVYSPKEIRDALDLQRNAGKKDIEAVIRGMFPDFVEWPKGTIAEHSFDATATIVTFLKDEDWSNLL